MFEGQYHFGPGKLEGRSDIESEMYHRVWAPGTHHRKMRPCRSQRFDSFGRGGRLKAPLKKLEVVEIGNDENVRNLIFSVASLVYHAIDVLDDRVVQIFN